MALFLDVTADNMKNFDDLTLTPHADGERHYI